MDMLYDVPEHLRCPPLLKLWRREYPHLPSDEVHQTLAVVLLETQQPARVDRVPRAVWNAARRQLYALSRALGYTRAVPGRSVGRPKNGKITTGRSRTGRWRHESKFWMQRGTQVRSYEQETNQ